MIRLIATALAAVGIAVVTGPNASAQSAPVAAWVQWAADGTAHARAISRTTSCPNVIAGTTVIAMTQRAGPNPSFPDRVCDVQLPSSVAHASVETLPLPLVPRVVKRIAIIGDNGCRTTVAAVETCNDPAVWPFPAIVRSIVAAHPDLVIHLGDYVFRTSLCPTGIHCTETDFADNANEWLSDYFRPMAPLLAIAPIVQVRGTNESCDLNGWSRYLTGAPTSTCVAHEPPSFIRFENLLLGNVDDSGDEIEAEMQPPLFIADLKAVQARASAAQRDTWVLSHRPAITYLLTNENSPPAPDVAAYLSGHVHVFGAYSLLSEGALVLAGLGGNGYSSNDETKMLVALGGVTEREFGYVLADRDSTGWTISVHDSDGTLHRSCRMAARKITCGPALTGTR